MHEKDFKDIPRNKAQGSIEGMKVPEGYFDTVDRQIWDVIHREKLEDKVLPLNFSNHDSYSQIWPKLAVAATLIMAFFSVVTNFSGKDSELIQAEHYVYEVNLEDASLFVDDELLADNLSLAELEMLEVANKYVSSDEIMEYLKEESMSEYMLIENLNF